MGGAIRVVYVDDPAVARLTAEFLERGDDRIEVVAETRAADGLDRLADEPIDCVVRATGCPTPTGSRS